MSRHAADDGRLVYVGNLPDDVRERDIDDLFGKYGRIRSVDIKMPARPPPFAFVEFDDPRDAQDAVRRRDGYDFYGCRLRVELAKGRRSRDAPRGREGRAPNTGYRVLVKGLPTSASWQDLKDFFRQVTRPAFTDVVRDRDGDGVTGIVEFDNAEDMDRAIRKLDDTEFRNPYDRCYVRLFEDQESRGRGSGGGSYGDAPRGRSRSPRRRSRSPRPRSRSRTRSPVRGNNDDNDDSNYNNDRRTLPQLGSPAPAE